MEANGALANGGADDGLANGGGDGLANGGADDGLANGGADDGLANGGGDGLARNGLANGAGDGLADGAGDGLANGAGDGLVNGAGDGLSNGARDGLANGGGDGLANGAGDGLANGAGDGLVNGAGDGLANGGRHHDPTPMPLFFFGNPDHVNLQAVDIGNRVSRPVIRFTCPNHEAFRIHGSCHGILLLSCGDRLYACNPFTRRWRRLPPLHVDYDIVGFYMIEFHTDPADFDYEVLSHDRKEYDCTYYLFKLGRELPVRLRNCSPTDDLTSDDPYLLRVIADGIVPSHQVPPVTILYFLHWLPQPAQINSNIIMYDIVARSFDWIPSPSIRVNGENFQLEDDQLFEINEHLAITSISMTRVDVWVLSNITSLWSQLYHIHLPVDVINLNHRYFQDGTADVFAVTQDRNAVVQCPHVIIQCDVAGNVLNRYQLDDHWTSLSGHTIEESLRLDPNILPMRDIDAVGDDPPFFQTTS